MSSLKRSDCYTGTETPQRKDAGIFLLTFAKNAEDTALEDAP
jgi:hypothetical protein